jgi:hypothetical protein
MLRSGRKSQDDQPNDSQTGTKRPWPEGVESNIMTEDLGFKRSAFSVLRVFAELRVFARNPKRCFLRLGCHVSRKDAKFRKAKNAEPGTFKLN